MSKIPTVFFTKTMHLMNAANEAKIKGKSGGQDHAGASIAPEAIKASFSHEEEYAKAVSMRFAQLQKNAERKDKKISAAGFAGIALAGAGAILAYYENKLGLSGSVIAALEKPAVFIGVVLGVASMVAQRVNYGYFTFARNTVNSIEAEIRKVDVKIREFTGQI